jgi:steroid Delta-isomerase
MTPAEGLEQFERFWREIAPASAARVGEVYAPDAHFRDPFNDVRGAEAIGRVVARMFETTIEPRFVILEAVAQGAGAFLVWNFEFRARGWKPGVVRRIHGASHVRFDASGKVAYHRDYWDAAGELYATLPLVGPVVRWLARRLG